MNNTIAISGANGFIGKALTKDLTERGKQVIPIYRSELYSNFEQLADKLSKCDVVIHLSGAPIFTRWNEKKKQTFWDSRILTTKNLVRVIGELPQNQRPSQLIHASAIGIYSPNTRHNEESLNLRTDFLGNLIVNWELEASNARGYGLKVTPLRLATVLDHSSGTFARLQIIYKLFLGMSFGKGSQIVNWISIDDVKEIIDQLINNQLPTNSPINMVAPYGLSYDEFHNELSAHLNRPSLLRMPSSIIKLLLGDISDELLSTPCVVPSHLINSGYQFKHNSFSDFLSRE